MNMKKLILGAALAVLPLAAWSDNTWVQKETSPTPKATPKAETQKASKAIRLTDAELDKITAGTAEVINGGGLTIVLNPGNANVLKFNKNHIVCINCF